MISQAILPHVRHHAAPRLGIADHPGTQDGGDPVLAGAGQTGGPNRRRPSRQAGGPWASVLVERELQAPLGEDWRMIVPKGAVVATTVLAGMARVSHIDPLSGRAVGSGRTLIDPWDDFSPGRWLWFSPTLGRFRTRCLPSATRDSGIGISRSDDTGQPLPRDVGGPSRQPIQRHGLGRMRARPRGTVCAVLECGHIHISI